jgi:glycerol kinase
MAYQVTDLLEAMQEDSGIRLAELRVDGGAAANDLLLQFQADLLGVPVVRPAVTETTALGAAYLAGLAVGVWETMDEIAGHWRMDRFFEPKMPRSEAARLLERWRDALRRSGSWLRAGEGA